MRLEEEFSELISQQGEIEQICKTALENWRSVFNRNIFLSNLKKYRELIVTNTQDAQGSEPPQELSALFKYFKDVRKAAMYLRTTFLFFDLAHEEPEGFHTFVWQLGQLKDTFYYPDRAVAHASILIELLSVDEAWGQFVVRPDTVENSLKAVQAPFDRIKRLLELEEYPAEDYHHLRKKLRLFANIYTIAVKYGRLGKVKELKDLLIEINDELGETNDELVDAALRGDKPYQENIITLPQELRAKIKQLFLAE
jgi:hypothetical protein